MKSTAFPLCTSSANKLILPSESDLRTDALSDVFSGLYSDILTIVDEWKGSNEKTWLKIVCQAGESDNWAG